MKYINKFASIEAGNERLDLKAPQLALVNNQKVCSKRIAAKKFVEFTEDEIDSHIELVEVTPEICLTFANGETLRLKPELIDGEYVLNNYILDKIDPVTYQHNDSITQIRVSSPIEKIDSWTFSERWHLTNVIIDESVTEIGSNAFNGCIYLESVVLPNTITEIKSGTFSWCWGLRTIEIPEGVTTIGDGAFENTTSLDDITLPNGLETIGDSAFKGSGWGIDTIIIPSTVTTIGNDAFHGITSLTTITLNEGLESIGTCAFMTNGAFPNTITIPSTVTSIGNGAFGTSAWESQWSPTAYFNGTKQQWISRFGTEGYIFSWKYYHGPNYTQVTLCTIPIHCANNETVDYTSLGWEAPQQE